MADRIMFVQLKTGHNADKGPTWISRVKFSKSWQTAYWYGRTLQRRQRIDGNFHDIDTGEEFWTSGPRRDLADTRYSRITPLVDDDVQDPYKAFLHGSPLPGREHG